MKNKLNWQLLHSFLMVAQAGGLTQGAKSSGISIPTLSRHIQNLETQIGEPLFTRTKSGFHLTMRGMALFDQVQAMSDIAEQSSNPNQNLARDVKISCGDWTAHYLAGQFATAFHNFKNWKPILIPKTEQADISRRETDLGIRNAYPESSRLAAIRIGSVRYGICQALGRSPSGFISADRPLTPSSLWTEQNGSITLRVGASHLGLPFLRAGIAKMLIPLFIANSEKDLEIIDIIDELTTPQYLVMHENLRHQPHIRSAIQALRPMLKEIANH